MAATHKPAVWTVPDFISKTLTLMRLSSPSLLRWEFKEGLRNFGYYELREKRGGVEFIDLDSYEQERFTLEGEKFDVYVSKLVLDESFVKISPYRVKDP